MISYNPFSLEGKNILVTGASSGIGKATAIECSKMGANVIITGRDNSRLKETFKELKDGNHLNLKADLTKDDDIRELVNNLPVLDGLVLCAGISETVLTKFATRNKILKTFEINFFANVEFLRQILQNKKISSGSSVIAIASIGGIESIDIGGGVYGASKAALSSWIKFLALELAAKKIRANSICPGMVWTPMNDPTSLTKEQLLEDEKHYPLKRYGQALDIAYACVYFLSDASKWITGTNFIIDGGKTI